MKRSLAPVGFVPLRHGEISVKPLGKISLVIAGYGLALAMAATAVACHIMALSALGLKDYSGMNAFGDFLLFMGVFWLAASPANVAALFFLRPYPAFWRVFSSGAVVFGVIGLAAFAVWFVADAQSTAAGLAFFRLLAAPLAFIGFLLSACFAPNRRARLVLFSATAMEATVFAGWLITCLVRNS